MTVADIEDYGLVTIAYKDFIFCLLSLHTHSEGTVSQIFFI